jgi:hypothetical protein
MLVEPDNEEPKRIRKRQLYAMAMGVCFCHEDIMNAPRLHAKGMQRLGHVEILQNALIDSSRSYFQTMLWLWERCVRLSDHGTQTHPMLGHRLDISQFIWLATLTPSCLRVGRKSIVLIHEIHPLLGTFCMVR